ncbi:unnamed protein product, partial [Allacma fusca]
LSSHYGDYEEAEICVNEALLSQALIWLAVLFNEEDFEDFLTDNNDAW